MIESYVWSKKKTIGEFFEKDYDGSAQEALDHIELIGQNIDTSIVLCSLVERFLNKKAMSNMDNAHLSQIAIDAIKFRMQLVTMNAELKELKTKIEGEK
jgi:hypothetical protein